MEGEWDTDGHAAPATAPRVPGEPHVSECVCVCVGAGVKLTLYISRLIDTCYIVF